MSDHQVLVDGMFIAYRSQYAYKDLKTASGQSTGLVFGFIRSLIEIKKTWPNSKIIVCWDSKSTWRKELYEGYKAGRSSKRDWTQLKAAAEACKHLGLDQAYASGQEADDVIGTLAQGEIPTTVYSRDKDFCQLVKNNVVDLYSPKSGQVPMCVYTEEQVQTKFGVPASKVLMYRALRGDSSDNLPGLYRFPSKKIIQLVTQHSTIEDAVNNTQKVSLTPREAKVLGEFSEQAKLNYTLMQIQTDIDVQINTGFFDKSRLFAILNQFQLSSLKSQVKVFDDPEEEMFGLLM